MRCPQCGSVVEERAAGCPACGGPLTSPSQLPTGLATPSVAAAARRHPSSPVGRLASSETIDSGGFTPGTILAERYRVIGLIGRGGMGDVYRADDLKLGQPVALKFLPDRLSSDRSLLDRFFSEVRTARSVAHPNVCRVYDIGEVDGRHFLSMEYVDGEDLASLLRRIGRLPQDKALELSRQLCAGLAAAHERGILHRDLKPANVMVDGRGRARIMDFGLAVAAAETGTAAEIGGTPAYMAPEQFAGKGASVRSDLYALGLVLYELFTGRRAFDAGSVADYRRKHAEQPPTSPSALVAGMEPAVERAILRCIEKDPRQRPSSAVQVAAALPGGDPLAAALAAGETPSPEMVAAAGQQGGISPSTARRLLLGLAAALGLAIWLSPRANIASFVGVEKSPEVLRERAREILESAGLGKPADYANWFRTDESFLDWARGHGGFGGDLSRDAVAFDYRQAPAQLVPALALTGPFPTPLVDSLNPAPVQSGMAEVSLDPRGRLVRLAVVPPQLQNETSPAPETDWSYLFRQAGLDIHRFAPVEPRWSPLAYATTRAAWEGPHPEHPGVTMRVEAASYRGRPVSFLWVGPWTRPVRESSAAPQSTAGAGDLVFEALLLLFLLGGAVLARRNVRAGRGDRRGAVRLGAAILVLQSAMWAFGGHHVTTSDEGWIFISAGSNAAGMAIAFWVLYLALEPFARRRWPEMLISWTRALSGRWRDPLVGRDLLVGAAVGTASGLILGPMRVLLPMKLGIPGPSPHGFDQGAPVNPGGVVAWLISAGVLSAFWVLGIVFLLVLVRRVVRYGWLAGLVVTLVSAGVFLGSSGQAVTLPLAVLSFGILVAVTVRFGVLTAIAAETCRRVFGYLIYSNDPSSWDFYAGMIAVAAVLALAYWATKTALAGQPLFGTSPSLGE
ncbi:MAG: protein kinase domain-containing protein [Acidobacteriota bacterium]